MLGLVPNDNFDLRGGKATRAPNFYLVFAMTIIHSSMKAKTENHGAVLVATASTLCIYMMCGLVLVATAIMFEKTSCLSLYMRAIFLWFSSTNMRGPCLMHSATNVLY